MKEVEVGSYLRVGLLKLKNLVRKGKVKKVLVCPNKCYPESMFSGVLEVEGLEDLEKKLSSFSYYNCNFDAGYYLSYYVDKEGMVDRDISLRRKEGGINNDISSI